MAKRFIDTGLFEDEWFSEITMEAKIFWVYYLTRCDHAGCMKYNKRLMEFQTGVKKLETVIKELGNRLVRVNEQLLFCPKFIDFQYPGFPKSKVRQQDSALKILISNGIWNEENKEFNNSYLTLSKDLPKSYVHDSDSVSDSVSGNGNEHDSVKKPKKENLVFPFNSTEFMQVWGVLSNEQKWAKKSISALQASLDKLSKHSEADAIQMMKDSIAGGWQGLFELKKTTNGNSKTSGTGFTREGIQREFEKRFANRQQNGGDAFAEAI